MTGAGVIVGECPYCDALVDVPANGELAYCHECGALLRWDPELMELQGLRAPLPEPGE